AWLFKKGIIIAIICLIIATALELAGPLIAKRVIDHHILGVEGVWQEVEEEEDLPAVTYDDKQFVRADKVDEEERNEEEMTVLAVGRTYYVTKETIPLTGKRKVEGNELTITTSETFTAEVTPLSINEISRFFAVEKKPIFILLILYMVLLLIAGVFQFF